LKQQQALKQTRIGIALVLAKSDIRNPMSDFSVLCLLSPVFCPPTNMVTTDQTGRLSANQPTHKNLLQKLSLLVDHNGRFTSKNTLRAGKNL
jgi:hypothetical protein